MPVPDLHEFRDPPREFSLAPFWFWNDELEEAELLRQMDDFLAHGVYRFVIHPRVGLPRSIGWMSERYLYYVKYVVEAAAERGMQVVLYDEGMYPSGSSAGQIVAENPALQVRGWVEIDLDAAELDTVQHGVKINDAGEIELAADQTLVAEVVRQVNGHRIAIVDRPTQGFIRGLHFTEEDPPRGEGEGWSQRRPAEDELAAADLLNPETAASFIRLVHEKYRTAVGEHFGKTITAIFTDEPMLLGRPREKRLMPGTSGLLSWVSDWLGYDFTPHLPALWYDDEPEAAKHRANYHRALIARLGETYYQPLSQWCEQHGLALTGHPAEDMEIGSQRWFQEPGQDLVWEMVLPGEKAWNSRHATTAKCASSAMLHHGRRRNANEFLGAYGDRVGPELYKWLADWLLVRGCNDLMPHAFFYSIRGPRIDECPPQLGPHASFWTGPDGSPDGYRTFADYCRRLCWLNTDSQQVCDVAVLGLSDVLPWQAAGVLQKAQIDFNYLEARHLWEEAIVDEQGVHLAGMTYKAIILDGIRAPGLARSALAELAKAGRVILWRPESYRLDPPGARMVENANQLLSALDPLIERDVICEPRCEGLRVRHVRKGGDDWYFLFNETRDPLDTVVSLAARGERYATDPLTVTQTRLGERIRLLLPGFAMGLIRVVGDAVS